jgi:hypothetical protein
MLTPGSLPGFFLQYHSDRREKSGYGMCLFFCRNHCERPKQTAVKINNKKTGNVPTGREALENNEVAGC